VIYKNEGNNANNINGSRTVIEMSPIHDICEPKTYKYCNKDSFPLNNKLSIYPTKKMGNNSTTETIMLI